MDRYGLDDGETNLSHHDLTAIGNIVKRELCQFFGAIGAVAILLIVLDRLFS